MCKIGAMMDMIIWSQGERAALPYEIQTEEIRGGDEMMGYRTTMRS